MPALIERPKMSRAMWDALKNHIMKERQRKKQEQEADAAIERLRRERENKQKQDVMTLEETKEQIQQLEQRLGQLKEEKHQLFLQLKKVLNEDEIRRRAVPKETNDMISFGHGYPPPASHPVFLQTTLPGRNTLYKIGVPPQPSHITTVASLKRPRSPSPPGFPPGYNYKAQAVSAHNQSKQPNVTRDVPAFVKLGYIYQEPGPYSQTGTAYYHHHSSNAAHSTSTPPYSTQSVYSSYSAHSSFPPGTALSAAQQSPSAAPEQKHVTHSYHVQHLQPQNYGTPLPSQLEQEHKNRYGEEMYFGVQAGMPIRSSSSVHHGQTLVLAPQQAKPGGITSGYPVRGQPTQASTANFQSQAQHPAYVSARHTYSAQGQPAGRYY